MILTKAKAWSYESEFRLISTMPNAQPNPLSARGECFVLPPNALKSVIVGCRANYSAVSEVVRESAPNLPVKRTRLDPNQYRLVIGR
jgi:hypothetical protein